MAGLKDDDQGKNSTTENETNNAAQENNSVNGSSPEESEKDADEKSDERKDGTEMFLIQDTGFVVKVDFPGQEVFELPVSSLELVQEIQQVLMDKEETCHCTCFSLQLNGQTLDNFAELKNTELLRERLALANEMREYVGKFYSVNYIRKNVLKQNEREIEQMDTEIKKEIDDGIIQSPMAQVSEEKK